MIRQRVQTRTRAALVASVEVGRDKCVLASDIDGLGGVALHECALGDLALDLSNRLMECDYIVFGIIVRCGILRGKN
jgi:hypothetical protein